MIWSLRMWFRAGCRGCKGFHGGRFGGCWAVAVKDESTDDEKGVDLGKDESEDDDSDGYYSEDDKTWLANYRSWWERDRPC